MLSLSQAMMLKCETSGMYAGLFFIDNAVGKLLTGSLEAPMVFIVTFVISVLTCRYLGRIFCEHCNEQYQLNPCT